MSMNVDTMSIYQVYNELISRNSRTSGTQEACRQRLKRFLEFEDQKQRRFNAILAAREDQARRAALDEVCASLLLGYDEEEERVARRLLDLRDDRHYLNSLVTRMKGVEQAFSDLDESYEVMVAENLRLNNRINNLEMRLSHVENRSDSPPPLILHDSNPNWALDTAFTA